MSSAAANAAPPTMANVAAVALATVKFTKQGLKELSAREFIEAGFELVLSALLAVSFFECPEESRRDEQELQTLYTMSWPPAILSAFIVYGHRVSKRIGPAPERFDQNLRRSKVFTWIYSLAFLIWDPDMVLKRGPALHVAIIFCICDVVRFELELSGLMEGDDDDDEIERLAAAVSALETDHHQFPGAGGKHAPANRTSNMHERMSSSNSLDSFHMQLQKQSKLLERQSTESLTHEFRELTTPAPGTATATGVTMTTTGKKPAGLETLKAPATGAAPPSAATAESSLNSGEPRAHTQGSPGQRGVVFEF